jgi:hypothetical protein
MILTTDGLTTCWCPLEIHAIVANSSWDDRDRKCGFCVMFECDMLCRFMCHRERGDERETQRLNRCLFDCEGSLCRCLFDCEGSL